MIPPKVSVSLITYNHEKYIATCLDSIVKQVVDFSFEIVVSDDCSTDGTAGIIADYALKYPALIKPVFRKENIGMVKNGLGTISACAGKYIAIMEGDDFWLDDHKLQAQADYLDNNEDCVFCYTNGYIFYENEPGKKQFFYTDQNRPKEKFDLDYFIANNPLIPNNTKMFRREAQPEIFPDLIYQSINWDWVLHVLQARNGNIGYLDRVTLAYRRHREAAFASKSDIYILLSGIATATALNKYLSYKYDKVLKNLWWEYRELAFAYLKNRKPFKFLIYYSKYVMSLDGIGKMKVRDELWRIRATLRSSNNTGLER